MMSDMQNVLAITDSACKAELAAYCSGEPPTPRRVCMTLRLWSPHCPGQVTPACGDWAQALRVFNLVKSSHIPTSTIICNGHTEGDGAAVTAMGSMPTTSALRDADSATEVLLLHLRRLTDWARECGRADQLYPLAGSCELVVHQLHLLGMLTEDLSGCLGQRRADAELLLRQLRQLLRDWHRRQLAARLLTEPASQDWEDYRAAEEGGRCSFAVQWWWFHMQALRHDAKEHLSAALASELFSELLIHSLGEMVVHYGQVTLKSEERATELRLDLIVLLLCASELSFVVASFAEELLTADHDSPSGLLADQCRALLLLLGHLTAPLKVVHKRCCRSASRQASAPAWFSLLRPDLVPPDAVGLHDVDTNAAVYMHLRLVGAAFPSPDCWPLLARALVTRDLMLPVLLLAHLTERDETDQSADWGADARTACHAVLCSDAPNMGCAVLGAASARGLFSALVLAVTRAVPARQPLRALLAPCLDRLPERSCPTVWNQRRPLWLQSLVDLARPLAASAVAALVEDVQESGAPEAGLLARMLVQYLCQVVADLPPALAALGNHQAPPLATPPLGLTTHVLLCALYDVLNDQEAAMALAGPGQERRVADTLVAVGEALCRPDGHVQREVAVLSEAVCLLADLPPPPGKDDTEEETPAAELAARICCDQAGRRALWLIAAVLRENGGWLRRQLGVAGPLAADWAPSTGARLSLRLHETAVFWPAAAMLSVGGSRLDQRLVAQYRPDWRHLLSADLGQTKPLVRSLVARRWDLQPEAALPDGQVELVDCLWQCL